MASQVKRPGPKAETFTQRLFRKSFKDPLVPIGCLLTGGVLGGGLYTLYTGQAGLSQKFMRARILAQGVTVVVLCTGTVLMGNEAMKGGPRETLEQKMLRERMEDRQHKQAAAAVAAAAAATKAS
mmetsp:Transcript_107055/g.310818  ORF Transcript_107055/g.310818 Transcript_107055/m.310818 type:complete len:125 (+) Transcript_107055:1118-1492(+)|eukprot:CAMPEP_0182522380 /NCGR_PEP_ID=MMETSP1323-20130603/248_1 /TAXON_ID=236787 /ORGANISM="Florenciella parvula, Strain RCC1693" /LENGTH=124 /DNA_ID=CAMNT_0024730489 /DNA_START=25 /DNA_END=399 /DNA_ORIENTATION=+